MTFRTEKDSLGDVKVETGKLWGAQTQRALENFAIGNEIIDIELVHSFGLIKMAAAKANQELGLLDDEKADLILQAAKKVAEGELDEHFPMPLWHSGSGTQTNMNVNEVIANKAIELSGGKPGSKKPVHPNDDVNCSQSSNDTFPTAMHVAAVMLIEDHLLPSLDMLYQALSKKSTEFEGILKIGRTHLMDAVPLTLGQVFSGYSEQVRASIVSVLHSLGRLYPLPFGGTAVGTGLNTHPDFAAKAITELNALTGKKFSPAENRFAEQAAHDGIVCMSGSLKTLAMALYKIANDIRWLASGPRCGIGELKLPANEPGSSIMPGKVNPSQCEAMMMVCTQVFGNDAAISFAGSQGNFELNTFNPVMIHNLLQSVRILTDASRSFAENAISGIEANEKVIKGYLNNSLMLVTALTGKIGYDKAAKAALKAHEEDKSLRDVVVKLGYMDEEEFDKTMEEKFFRSLKE